VTTLARRREIAIGWSATARREPASSLRPFVTGMWEYVEHYTRGVGRRELPSGDIVVTLSFGPTLRVWDGSPHANAGSRAHRSFVAGLAEHSVVTEMDGESDGMQLNVTPIGARLIFGLPMHELADRVVRLDDVLGPAQADELLERLRDERTWGMRFDRLEAWIARRLSDAAMDVRATAFAWTQLRASNGRRRIEDIARELGWSRRRLADAFRDDVGLTPKVVARLTRFERALRRIQVDDGAHDWATIAIDSGYYDQAHFTNEFRAFANCTPTEYEARQLPEGLGLAPG
jgi:AraC-like DNA-binding protein